jgi:hypothetical protein
MFTYEFAEEKEWIKVLKKERPDLDIKRMANGEYFVMNRPANIVQVKDILDLVDVHSDFDEFHTHNRNMPVLIKRKDYYAITFCYFDQNEWEPMIRLGLVYLFNKK